MAARDDHRERQDDAKGRRSLQPPCVVAALFVRHVLGNVSNGAAVFTAKAEALDHAQTEQNKRCSQTDLIEGRDQTDAAGADAHAGQRQQEGILATDAVAHPAEEEGAKRADEEARGKQRDSAEQRRDRMRFFEELDRQDRSQAAENIEVIPLDNVADRRSDDHCTKVLRDLRSSHIALLLIAKHVAAGMWMHQPKEAYRLSCSTTALVYN